MPIKDGKYKNPNWVNGGPPAIDADELNAISSTLESLDAAGGTGGDGKRYARIVIGTSTNGWTAADCDYLWMTKRNLIRQYHILSRSLIMRHIIISIQLLFLAANTI
jgi:hypothetical protein